MAKLVRRVTSNDEIVGSNPARGTFLMDVSFDEINFFEIF